VSGESTHLIEFLVNIPTKISIKGIRFPDTLYSIYSPLQIIQTKGPKSILIESFSLYFSFFNLTVKQVNGKNFENLLKKDRLSFHIQYHFLKEKY